MRIALSFDRNTSNLMEQHCFCYKKTFSVKGGVECLVHCFSIRTELPVERNTAYLSGFSTVKNITFVQNNCFPVNGSNMVPLGRKSPMLEAGGSSTSFPCEN
jgi:hypothetical protein